MRDEMLGNVGEEVSDGRDTRHRTEVAMPAETPRQHKVWRTQARRANPS